MDKKPTLQKPEITGAEYYADAKQTITLGVRNLIRAFPIPIFMIESILQGILLEYRNEAYMEYASCVDEYKQKTEEYYEAQIKEMREAFEREREELIQAFENPVDQEEPREVPDDDPDPEATVTVEKKYIDGENTIEEVD